MATVAGTRRLLDISGNNISTEVSLQALGTLLDNNGQSGTAGQILSSTGSGIDWVANSVIPIVNNSTITLTAGDVLDGGGAFTLNQAFNETIEFDLATGGAGAGFYGSTSNSIKIDQITLDSYGRITAVSTGATGQVNTINSGNTNLLVSSGTSTVTLTPQTAAVTISSAKLATGAQIQAAINTATTGVLSYQGTWNANTNSPALASGVGTPGYYYIVSTAGSTNLDGITDWAVGDWAVFSDLATDAWQKIDNTQVGNVTGSGSSGRVAYWNSNSNITSDADLTFDGSNLTVGGNLTVTGNQYFNGSVIEGDGKEMFKYSDAWLRINEDSDFSSGIYCGTGVLRTDGAFQVGSSGTKFLITSAGAVTAESTLTLDNGQIVLGGTGRIQGVDTVSATTDAANKAYVDASVIAADYAPVKKGTSTITSAGWTTVCTVNGNALGSTIRMTVAGTGPSTVIATILDIVVNHSLDIMITSQTSSYTILYVKIVSNNNEDFAVQLKTNSSNNLPVNMEVFALNSEAITFTSTNPYTGASLEHECKNGGFASSSSGGSAHGYWSNGTKLGVNITGNAATVTNGVYTTGNQTIGGSKNFSSTIAGHSVNLTSGNGITTQRGSGTVAYPYAISASQTGLFAASDNANSIITLNRHPGNYYSQLGFSSNGNLYYRNFVNTAINTTQAWNQIAFTSSLSGYLPVANPTFTGTLAGPAATITTVTGALAGNADTATLAANSTLAGGLAVGTGVNNSANQIVRTDVNGYTHFGWINSISGNTTATITRITASNDAYLRYVTPATFRSQVIAPYFAPIGTVSGVTSVNFKTDGTALNVVSNTITGIGTMTGIWQGTASEYVNGLGDRVTFPTIPQGDITSVNAGTNLNGGGTSGAVTLNLDAAIELTSVQYGSGVTLSESSDRADLLYINSSTSTWGGLQIGNTSNEFIFSLMGDGNVGGIYDDQNADWIIQWTENSGIRLYHNGVQKFTTTSTGVTISGALVADGGNSAQWNTAYDNSITGLAVTGTTTKTLTATQQDGGTLTASWTDNNDNTNWYVNAATFNTGNGIITGTGVGSAGFTVDIDGRYLPLAGGVMSGKIGRSSHNVGFLEGSYNNVGANGGNTNPIYTIGSNYNPASSTLGNMYGIGYCSAASASFVSLTGAAGWGMYVAADGDARIFLDAQNGRISASGTIYASGGNSGQWNTHTSNTGTISSINATTNGNSLGTSNTLTGNGTLTLAWQGNTASYVRGDGSLATFPSIPQGDITNVTAGTGMTGGGSSGSVTLNVIGGDGITANANDVAVDYAGSDSLIMAAPGGSVPDADDYMIYGADSSGGGESAKIQFVDIPLSIFDNDSGFITSSSLPTVNNGQIDGRTSGNGLSGSMDATANQSGNTTFTVTSNATTAATANTIAYRNGSADINARLFRSNYQNQSNISGAIAFRTNTSDNYIRFCNSPSAIRTFIGAASSSVVSGVTSIATTSPILGGTITGSGTLSLKVPVSGAWHNGGVPIVGASTEIGRYLDFHTNNNGTSDFDIRLDANGSELNCSGNIRSQGNLEAVGNIVAGRAKFTSGTTALPSFSFTSDPNTGFSNPSSDRIETSTGGVSRWATNNYATVINQDLGVGITPLAKFHVNGTSLVRTTTGVGDFYLGNVGSNKYFRFHTNNSETFFGMNCGTVRWRQGSSTRFYFYPSTANMTINGTLTQNSDSRVKENVVEIDNCISKVQAMRGVYYNRTDFNTETTKVGVIAQEVEAVLPELILESPDDGLKSVAYAELTAVLINAIKEQQEIIEDLKTRITKLEK